MEDDFNRFVRITEAMYPPAKPKKKREIWTGTPRVKPNPNVRED